MVRLQLFENFDRAESIKQSVIDSLVDLRDNHILFKVSVTPDKFSWETKRDINIDIQSSFGSTNNLFDNEVVYPSLLMLDDYLKEYFSNVNLKRIQYFASVNGNTFTEIQTGNDIRLISSIKIRYEVNEN